VLVSDSTEHSAGNAELKPDPSLSTEECCAHGDECMQNGNYDQAVVWFRRAAECGYEKAQYNLGTMYANGQGVRQDDAEAMKWCRLEAMKWCRLEAMKWCRLEAVKWWRLAAEQGHIEAQFTLGMIKQDGLGVPQDAAEAAKWYRLAAEQGHAEAQCQLGRMYDQGRGVPQDNGEAVRWFCLSVKQGNAAAQDMLARLNDAHPRKP